MKLETPSISLLPDYREALRRGWFPDNLRPAAAQEQIAAIDRDPEDFVARQTDPDARGGPVTLPDGSKVPRLPSFRRWIWSDGYCGSIGLRWQPGTEALPPTCQGHIGYSIVPWRWGEGIATAALHALLPDAAALGLRHVDLATDPDNRASQRVIEKCGGVLMERYLTTASLGAKESLRYRIALN